MDPLPQIAQFIAEVKRRNQKLIKLETSQEVIDHIKKQRPDLVVDGALFVDGVLIELLSPRTEVLNKLQQYCHMRYDVVMEPTDVEALFKAVSTEELRTLGPIIVDQHMDLHEYEDVLDKLGYTDREGRIEAIRGLGLEIATI